MSSGSRSEMRMLDLFCGQGGWTKGFMAEGWECVGVDVNSQPKYPGRFVQVDVLTVYWDDVFGMSIAEHPIRRVLGDIDFICASSPCEQFSVHCMKHFHPNPKWPHMGIRLFEYTRQVCEASGKPYIMENVRCAEKFVGKSANHCGPFYLWGSAVPAVMPRNLYKQNKGFGDMSSAHYHANLDKISPHKRAGNVAEIPLEISRYVAQCATELVRRARESRNEFREQAGAMKGEQTI